MYKITCPTEELFSKLTASKIFPDKKICFLQDAIINFDNFKSSQMIDYKKYGIINKKVILAVGRLTAQKNFSYLISEFSNFLRKNDNYVLVILGEGEEKNNLLKIVEKNKLSKHVYFLGKVNNVYDFMKSSDVFVLSSLWEELGFVIAEAALNNLFIISSDCPNGPKEFLSYGKNGIIYESNKKNSLVYALNKYTKMNNHFEKILNAKKNSRKYTKFNHHKSLVNSILN